MTIDTSEIDKFDDDTKLVMGYLAFTHSGYDLLCRYVELLDQTNTLDAVLKEAKEQAKEADKDSEPDEETTEQFYKTRVFDDLINSVHEAIVK